MVGGASIVFTRKAVVDETFIRKSNLCKSIVGIDASQLYPYSNVSTNAYCIVNVMGVRFWNQEIHSSPKQISLLENMVLSYFQQSRPDCKIESNVTTGRQKKIDCFRVDGIC